MIFKVYELDGFVMDISQGKFFEEIEVSKKSLEKELIDHSKKYGKKYGEGLYSRLLILEEMRVYLADFGSYSKFLGYELKE